MLQAVAWYKALLILHNLRISNIKMTKSRLFFFICNPFINYCSKISSAMYVAILLKKYLDKVWAILDKV